MNRLAAFLLVCVFLLSPVSAGLVGLALAIAAFWWWPNQIWQARVLYSRLLEEKEELEDEVRELEAKLAAARKRCGQTKRALEAECEAYEQAQLLVNELGERVQELEEEREKVAQIQQILGLPEETLLAG